MSPSTQNRRRRHWWNDAVFIARQDLRQILGERETLGWLLVMPLVFFYFIGTVTGGFGGGSGSDVQNLAVEAPGEPGFLYEQMARRMAENKLQAQLPNEQGLYLDKYPFEDFDRRLVLPEDFTASVLDGEPALLEFRRVQSGIGQDFDQFRLSRAVYSTLADMIALEAMGEILSAETFAELDAMPRSLTIETRPAGTRQEIPQGYEQTIPGIMVMFVLMQCLTGGAVLLVTERQQGLLRRLAATPISRASVVAGKWFARWTLGMIQVAVGMVYGTLIFSLDWGPDLAMVLLVLAAWAGLCASAGMLVGNLGSSEGQVVGLGVMATMVLAALGGCWWPIEITPPAMRALASYLPSGWAMDAMHQLISFQNGAGAALQSLLLISAGAVVMLWMSARRFRYE